MCVFVSCGVFWPGSFAQVRNGYLANAEDDVEGTTPVMIKTVKGGDDPCIIKGWDHLSVLWCHISSLLFGLSFCQ